MIPWNQIRRISYSEPARPSIAALEVGSDKAVFAVISRTPCQIFQMIGLVSSVSAFGVPLATIESLGYSESLYVVVAMPSSES